MVPEKGRNAGDALAHELPAGTYDIDWIRTLINGKGKRAAKTGVGFESVRAQIARLNQLNNEGDNNTFQLGFKHFGRLKPRPIFKYIELTDRRIEGYESPSDAWKQGAARFYGAYDTILEDLLARGAEIDLEAGFEAAVAAQMQAREYDRVDAIGNEVTWAAMSGAADVPDTVETVLVPETLTALGTRLAARHWDCEPTIETYEQYAKAQDAVESTDEEALLAAAPETVAGIYMFVSGSTAAEYGLAVEPISGAVSRLGVFESTSTNPTMTDITSLKGMYDRYPGEFSSWRTLIDTVEETAREFGFREIDTPAVERTELYRIKSGEELLDQTYSFEDRGGREVTLVPEQTPTRARMVQERKDLRTPIKWFDTSKRWRYENVQKGRDREFFQTDFDIFGIESVAADAEIIACGARIYQKLGVADSVEFLINDRRLLERILQAQDIENTREVMRVIDDKEKLSRAEFLDALTDRGIDRAEAETIDEITDLRGPVADVVSELRELAPEDEATVAAIDRMERLADQLAAYDVAGMCRLDLSIVRGLAYYTGLVFEAFDTEGELRALFGGGRYDDLVGLFGDRELPAVGFAFGYSTTRELLLREGAWPEERIDSDVYVAPVSESVQATATAIASDLRGAGLVVETDLADRALSDQFSYADSINASYVLVVGERDLEAGEVTLRDMATGTEENIPRERVTDAVLDALAE